MALNPTFKLPRNIFQTLPQSRKASKKLIFLGHLNNLITSGGMRLDLGESSQRKKHEGGVREEKFS